MLHTALRDGLHACARSWGRLVAIQLAALLGLTAVVAIAAAVVQSAGAELLAWLVADPGAVDGRAIGAASALIVAIVLLVLPIQLAALVATIRVVDRAVAGERMRATAALADGLLRCLPVLGALVLASLAVFVALVASPLLVVVGVLGLAVSGVIALVRRRRPTVAASWPAWRRWGFLAIPLSVLWRVSAAAVLVPPAAVLEPAGPLRAVRVADIAARGRRWAILVAVAVAVLVALAIALGAAWLGGALWGEVGASILGGLAQLVALPIPVVAAVVLYRRAAGPTGRVGFQAAVPTEARRRRRPGAVAVARVAITTVVALVLPLAVAVQPALAAPLPAATSHTGQTAAYVVTSATDTVDAAALDAQRVSCVLGGADCTIRAALALAEQDAADGALGATIVLDMPASIALVAPLAFAPDGLAPATGGGSETPAPDATGPAEEPQPETPPSDTPPSDTPPSETPPSETPPSEEPPPAPVDAPGTAIVPGVLTIVGGHGVALDGADAVQLLSVVSEYWDLDISGVRFVGGRSTGFAGALLAGVPHTTLTATVFEANTAAGGAGAVFARGLTIESSSFIGNRASGWSGSVVGGAVRATGQIDIVNATFADNGVGDAFTPGINRGSDVYADATMNVVNSTFVEFRGGSLLSAGGTSTLRNAVFSTGWTGGGLACSGAFTGAANQSQQGDTSCPGTAGVPGAGRPLVGARDDAGAVPVFPLSAIGNPAIGAGVDCPVADALGSARPAQGCDLGAVEFDGATAIAITTTASPTVYGEVTLRATVSTSSGAPPTGTVTFSLDDVALAPVPLDDPADPLDDAWSAELVVTGLDGGRTAAVGATFAADAPYDDSVAAAVDYTVQQVRVDVALSCASAATPGCASTPWRVADAESLHLEAAIVDDGRPGTVVIALDAAGSVVVAGPTPIVDGLAAIDLPAAAVGAGAAELFAVYRSDDGEHAGTSAARAVLVQGTPTVALTIASPTAVFGDPVAGAATVTVTGDGPTPTGTVTVFGHTATLDAAGVAEIDLSWLPVVAGPTGMVAQYGGDDVYAPGASAEVLFRTTRADASVSISSISPAAAAFGADLTVAVTVRATAPSRLDPRGDVRVLVDGDELVGAVAIVGDGVEDGVRVVDIVIPAGALAAGEHELVAEFVGGGSIADATSAPATALTIAAAATATTLATDPAAAVWGDSVTLTATVDGSTTSAVPTGTVAFSAGGRALGTAVLAPCAAPNADGCAVAILTVATGEIGIGTSALAADYAGSADFAASSGRIETFTVAVATPTVTVAAPASLRYGHTGVVTVTVAAGSAVPADGTEVVVSAVPGVGAPIPLGTTSLAAGVGTLDLTTAALLPPGAYTITAAVAADAHFAEASGTAALSVVAASVDLDLDAISATSVAYGRTIDVELTVSNESGALPPEGDVVLTWSGIEVGRATLGPADDGDVAGERTVTVTATFGPPITVPHAAWLTAEFVGAPGFADAALGVDAPDERREVTVTPLATTVSVAVDAVMGRPLEAVATVSVVGADAGVVPGGWITFSIIGSGLGSLGEFGPVALVDGRATLADAVPAGIPVTLAGTWSVRATYIKDGDPRTSSTSPNHTAVAAVDVDRAAATVEVDAPSAVELGTPLVIGVVVDGAVVPSGTVRLQFAESGGTLGDEVELVDGAATLEVALPSMLALGDHEFVVAFSGGGSLDPATSAPFTVRLGPTASAVSVDTSSRSVELYPGIVGATVQYVATVTTTIGTPSGFVTFSRDGIGIGQAPVESGRAIISITADEVWAGDIVATFTPDDGRVAPSSGRLPHRWVAAPVVATLAGPVGASIGTPARYSVVVRFDWSQFQFLPSHLRPPRAPSGMVTIGDGDVECSTTLVPLEDSTEVSSAGCSLASTATGVRTVTAAYAGDPLYVAAEAPSVTTTVAPGTPTVTVSTPGGLQWGGLSTIPVVWSVTGPSTGAVVVKLGTDVVCTSSTLSGACNVAVPAFGAGTTLGDRITLEYSGTPLWHARSAVLDGTIVACVPVVEPTARPVGSAAVELSPAPNCGGGTGYFASSLVQVQATAVDGQVIASIADRGWSYPLEQTTFWSDGARASVLATVRQVVRDGRLEPFEISATTRARCVTVTFSVTGIPDGQLARNLLAWQTQSACGDVVVSDGSSLTASFEVGAKVRVALQPAFLPTRTSFYGWYGPADDPFATATTFTVGVDERRITAAFGPVCYTGGATIAPPVGGTISTTPPAQNCWNPRIGTRGWVYGTVVRGELVDAGAASRTFFDAWTGDTGRVTFGPTSTRIEAGAPVTVRPFAYAILDSGFALGATYGRCAALTTAVAGDASAGSPGTVTISTPSNCPIGTPRSSTERWFRVGTSVTLSAVPAAGGVLKFLGWGGLALASGRRVDRTVTVVLSDDTAATAAFGTNANCRPISVTALPAGAITLTTRYWLGPNACEPLYGARFYDQGIAGNGVGVEVASTSPIAEGAEIVYAWATSPPGSPSGQAPTLSSVWARTSSLDIEAYGVTQIVASACQFVAIAATVRGIDGRTADGLGASNVDRASQTALGDFVRTPAADCSVGADPRSGYGGYAWLAGTQLLPVVVADAAAYRFLGWSGDVAGTGETPDAPLRLVGSGRRAQGDQYHARITATFEAICHTLSLPSDADLIEVVTAPNCPGADPSRRMYLGGTVVVLHATDRGDTLFRHWASGTDAIDADPRWASVAMTGDRTVVPYYSSKSLGEQFSTYGGLVGDILAVTSKKLVGIASATVSAYFKVLISKATLVASGIGYIAQGLEYVGVSGAAIDAMKNASSAMNSMISMLFAPMDCITAWSAGGSNTAVFAAQNLIGSAIVGALSSGAQQQQASTATNSLSQLKAQATALKTQVKPVITAVSAISAAKGIYDAGAAGQLGIETSAYDAWASRSSFSVYSACMAERAGGMVASVAGVVP